MTDNQQILDVLTCEGVLVAVNVRYWRARKKLDAQDVGFAPDDVTERLISLGHKRRLPRQALAQFALGPRRKVRYTSPSVWASATRSTPTTAPRTPAPQARADGVGRERPVSA